MYIKVMDTHKKFMVKGKELVQNPSWVIEDSPPLLRILIRKTYRREEYR